MELQASYILWNLSKDKIKLYQTIKITESDIIEMLYKKFNDEELPIPMYIDKDEVIVEFNITGGSF